MLWLDHPDHLVLSRFRLVSLWFKLLWEKFNLLLGLNAVLRKHCWRVTMLCAYQESCCAGAVRSYCYWGPFSSYFVHDTVHEALSCSGFNNTNSQVPLAIFLCLCGGLPCRVLCWSYLVFSWHAPPGENYFQTLRMSIFIAVEMMLYAI